jgi:hypothetical protein
VPGTPGGVKDERRKALLEQEMKVAPVAGPSRPRQSENAVAGPSRSGRSSLKTDADAMDRKLVSMRTNVEECLDEMMSEFRSLRDAQLKYVGEDDDERAKINETYGMSMESMYVIMKEFHGRLQSEFTMKKREIAYMTQKMQANGVGPRIS